MGGHKKGKKPDYDFSIKNIRVCLWNNKNRKGTDYVYGKIFRYRCLKDGGRKQIDLNGSEFQALKKHLQQCSFTKKGK